jgi:hypothetical protein
MEPALDGEDWLLESKVEIQIGEDITTQDHHDMSPEDLLDDMPTPRVGTGFQSLGEGDADDESELEEVFRGRSTRRSAIDITREHLGMASSWSNWDLKPQNVSRYRMNTEKSCGGRQTAGSLVRKMKDAELKSFAEKARRGLRLTIGRAKVAASKARSDKSRSPVKTEWDSGSSTVNTPTVVTRFSCIFESNDLPTIDPSRKHEETILSRRLRRASQGDVTGLPARGQVDDNDQNIVSAILIPQEVKDSDNTTPTSISSSAANDLSQTSVDKWEDHLRKDLGEGNFKHINPFPSVTAGGKSDIHFDADNEGRRLLSTDTGHSSGSTASDTSSGNWAALAEGQRLDEELAGKYLDDDDDHKRLLSSTIMQSCAATDSNTSSISSMEFAREVSTADIDRSIPDTARPSRHAQKPSVSSIASTTTAFSPSPQTSPPRPSPRMRQGLSFHPLATMLQVATPNRRDWSPRDSSLSSPPLSTEYRVGLEASPLQRSPTSGFVCVHERDCCAICGGSVGVVRVVSCVCDGEVGCLAGGTVVEMKAGMEVCDRCAGMR